MSALNIWVSPTSAMVGVDTQGAISTPQGALHDTDGFPIGSTAHFSKMIPLVHSKVVIAGRGHAMFLAAVFYVCHMMPSADFDMLAKELPKRVLAESLAMCRHGLKHAGVAADLIGHQELGIVGWSKEHQRMRGAVFIQTEGDAFITEELDDAYWAAPWNEEAWGEMPEPSTYGAMRSMARQQKDSSRSGSDWCPIGGELIVATVTNGGITVESLGAI